MTLECTVTKLAFLMGLGLRKRELKEAFERDMRGELTPNAQIDSRIVKYKTASLANITSAVTSPRLIKTKSKDNIGSNDKTKPEIVTKISASKKKEMLLNQTATDPAQI